MAYSYENELNALKEAQKKSAIADLENTKNQTLSDLEAEQQKNTANYAAQRNTANIQNKLGARNFQEYLASTGRANSGLASQAKLQSDNNLNTSLNAIRGAETASNADINRRTTNANNAYNSGLASANANIEANYINNLLAQREKAAQLELEQKKFDESVRQFNEQMAYNYANLYSGSGGGGSSGGSDDITTAFYSGKINPDAKYGTFSNGYQPNNYNGYPLTKTGETIDKIGTTLQGTKATVRQNVWKYTDGSGKVHKVYWNGNTNKYEPFKG